MLSLPLNSPAWLRDLILYEVATKGFTSPNGPESGTFRSMQARLPHLESLGITGIWLTGHSLADPDHFYNIWTQYAVIEPGTIDPTLGTEEDFKALIAEAHARGIRVFLDVIIHGVMKDSRIVAEHPDWFRGESWGMIDFDFDARIPALDAWWTNLWIRNVVEFGIDGYRIDLGMRRPDQWQQIREAAARAGREIAILNELDYDRAKGFSDQSGLKDYPARAEFIKQIDFLQRDSRYVLDPHHNLNEPLSSYGRADSWTIQHWSEWLDRAIEPAGAEAWAWRSVQMSCHDDGWENFKGTNPYVAQGNRFTFGYGALFSGMLPIFMSGEEFNAPYKPLPNLSPKLFGGSDPGTGTWAYGNQLDWSALETPEGQAMLADVQKMIAIRRQEGTLLSAISNYEERRIRRVDFTANIPAASPYLRWNEQAAILIVGNHSRETDLMLTAAIPVELLPHAERYTVTDLWTGTRATVARAELGRLPCTVPRDKTPGGGLRLYKVEAVN